MENFDKNNMRHIIDQELKDVRMEDELKRRIWSNAIYQRPSRISNRMWKTAAAFAAILVPGGATVSTGYRLLHQIQVNGEVLPELESMEIVEMNAPDAVEDENGLTD